MNADRCGTNKTTASRSNRERKLPVGDSGERVQFSSPPAAYAVGSRCAVVSVVPAARLLMALALVSVLCCASVGRSEEATGPAADTAPAGEAAAAAPAADDDIPLYQRLPYDEVQLDRANDNAVLRVQPIDFPEGEVPDPLPRTGFLEVELVDEPGETYRVAWPHVEEIRPFPQLVLNAAKESISQGQFESAYDHLQFVAEYYPDFAPQEDVVKRFLAAEAEELLAQQAYDRALSNLQRLHDLDAEYAGLQEALGHAINAMVERYVAEDDYPAARQLIGQLEAWYSGHPVAQQWTERWNREASELHAALREDLEAGNDRQAAATARRLMLVRPSLPGIEDAVREALSLYPRVRVGGDQQGGVFRSGGALRLGRAAVWSAAISNADGIHRPRARRGPVRLPLGAHGVGEPGNPAGVRAAPSEPFPRTPGCAFHGNRPGPAFPGDGRSRRPGV